MKNNAKIYSDGVPVATVERLGEYLHQVGFLNGTPTVVAVNKRGEGREVRVIFQAETAEATQFFGQVADELSRKRFDNHRVEVHLCDACLETIRRVASN